MLLKLVTGNGERERRTRNGQQATGNEERGTGKRRLGNGQRATGNECTAVISIGIQNGGRNDVNTDMKGKFLTLARSLFAV